MKFADLSSKAQMAHLNLLQTAVSRQSDEGPIPFLRWPGGKRWLCFQYSHLLPPNFNKYAEPFLGSGAVYFHIKPRKAILSDINVHLIETYCSIRDYPKKVYDRLTFHQSKHSDKYYYHLRDSVPNNAVERAARFIYLNRSCWNGLYRENKLGHFNVPKGTKTNILLPTDDFMKVSDALKYTQLRVADFARTIGSCREGDFLFVDPPYTVKHNNNGFVKYNQSIFSWDDQIRLREAVARAAGRGVQILVTNANHSSIHALYEDMGLKFELARTSVLAANSQHRNNTNELAICINYAP